MNSTISDLDSLKDGLKKMVLNFDAETPKGTITFKGELNKDEVDFLLRFAILSLMARGTLPVTELIPPASIN